MIHNHEVRGSIPRLATLKINKIATSKSGYFALMYKQGVRFLGLYKYLPNI